MTIPFSKPRFSGRATTVTILVAVVLSSWFAAPRVQSQMPATTTSNVALNTSLNKLKTQQDQLVANQTKIEAQTAQLEEALRQAKIYSARSGSGHR